ncbi:MAG: hypothetical protein H8D45_07575 [Bacteroidetes bacterium]|nr:hypothetical protein [Bacteroidota bacterium]
MDVVDNILFLRQKLYNETKDENLLVEKKFAEMIGIANETWSRWVNKKKIPSQYKVLQKICDFFNERMKILLSTEKLLLPNMQRDWEKIKQKTTYRIIDKNGESKIDIVAVGDDLEIRGDEKNITDIFVKLIGLAKSIQLEFPEKNSSDDIVINKKNDSGTDTSKIMPGLKEFLDDEIEMVIANPTEEEIELLKKVNTPWDTDKDFYRLALGYLRRSRSISKRKAASDSGQSGAG